MKNLKIKVISKYLRPYKKEFLYGALALLAVNILSVVIPLEVKNIIDQLQNGFSSDFVISKSLLLIVDGPAGADRHVQIPRSINVGAFSMAHQKAPQKVVIATEFKVLAPKSVSQFQELFRIVDNTNDTEVFDIN